MAAKDIHKETLHTYGEHCLSRQAVHNWVQRFSEGRTSIEDEHRVGRPVEIATPVTLQRVEDIIRADRRVTIDAVATAIGCSHKYFLYVIPLCFFSVTICNLLIDFPHLMFLECTIAVVLWLYCTGADKMSKCLCQVWKEVERGGLSCKMARV